MVGYREDKKNRDRISDKLLRRRLEIHNTLLLTTHDIILYISIYI